MSKRPNKYAQFSSPPKICLSTRIDKPRVPVSVSMIVKNCAGSLRECLQSLKDNFLREGDEILLVDTGSTDNTIAVGRSFGARVIERPDLRKDMGGLVKEWLPKMYDKFGGEKQFDSGCILDFAAARQIAMDHAIHDVIFWVDSDDVLVEETRGALRNVVEEHMSKDIDAIFLSYLYSFDKSDGRPTTILKRERIVDRTKYQWRGKCHETLIPLDGTVSRGVGWFENLRSAIVHKHGRSDHQLSDIRNYCIIRTEIEADLVAGRAPDVRSIFYMANALRGLLMYPECITMYNKALDLSGSRDDRFSAAYYICITYLSPDLQRPIEALDYAFRCVQLKPEDPRAYFAVARCYHILGKHADSMRFFDFGRSIPEPKDTLHSYDPEHIHTLPYFIAISAAKELNDEDRTKELTSAINKHRPDHPDVKAITCGVQNWLAGCALFRSVQAVTINMRPEGTDGPIKAARRVVELLPEVPENLEKVGIGKLEPVDPRLTVKCSYTDESGAVVSETKAASLDDDVAIWCGHSLEAWGPESDGIGGSEKAVIQMAPRLQARGLNVTVYCNVPPAQRGLRADGVVWRHWSELNQERPRGAVIFWRGVSALESPWPIRKRIYWGHDCQRAEHWTDACIAAADDIWFLTKFHAKTLGGETLARTESKIWYTRNGIDSDLFAAPGTIPRKDTRVVYCSSPDRGVMTAIKTFQAAFKDIKDAELHIAYGFNRNFQALAAKLEYGRVSDMDRDISFYDYQKLVMAEVDKDPRIAYHGRMTGADLANLMKGSKVWLYPTRFNEISCMSAMEAQAAGCAIVASDTGALAETIDWAHDGVHKVSPDNLTQCANRLRQASFEPSPIGLAKAAQDRFSYEKLADEWLVRIRK